MTGPSEPHLRSVPPRADDSTAIPAESGSASSGTRLVTVLGVVLAVALGLLVWSRIELARRVEAHAQEVDSLRQAIAERDLSIAERDERIAAQTERISHVRERLESVILLIDDPLDQ